VKIKGGALIYTLFIVVIIGTLVSLVLIISQYSAQNIINYQKSIQNTKNISSGIALLLDNKNNQQLNSEKEIILFDNENNKVINKKNQWGLYEIIGTSNLKRTEYKYAIVGTVPSPTTLYLSNSFTSLKLAGNTRIEGNCFIPERGVERANISGFPYTGEKLIYGTKQTSNKSLPLLNPNLYHCFDDKYLDTIVMWKETIKDSIIHSFSQKTLHYISSEPIELTNKSIKGNIIIESNQYIEVANNSNLKNIILKAPFIKIKENYTGTLQLLAEDSIIIENNVELKYPSSIFLYDKKSIKEKTGYIKIGRNSNIEGDVVAIQKEYNYRDKINITIGENTTLTGLLYINGVATLKKVKILGSLYCYSIAFKTGKKTIENTLLNTTISTKLQPKEYVGGTILKENKKQLKKIIEWL